MRLCRFHAHQDNNDVVAESDAREQAYFILVILVLVLD